MFSMVVHRDVRINWVLVRNSPSVTILVVDIVPSPLIAPPVISVRGLINDTKAILSEGFREKNFRFDLLGHVLEEPLGFPDQFLLLE